MLPREESVATAEVPAKSRASRSLARVLALLLSTALPARAAADTHDRPSGKARRDSARCPSPGSGASANAAEHFAEFQCWFEAGEPARALVALENACQGSADPACLFDRALLHHALLAVPDEREQEHCHVARTSYAAYLAAAPYEPAAGDVKSALSELGEICAPLSSSLPPAPELPPGTIPPLAPGETLPPLAPPPAPVIGSPRVAEPSPVARDPESSRLGTAPLLCYGMSAASAAAAGIFLVRAWQIHEDGKADVPVALKREYAADQELHGNLAAGFGVASLLWLGAAEFLRREQSAPKAVSFSLTPTYAGVGYERAF